MTTIAFEPWNGVDTFATELSVLHGIGIPGNNIVTNAASINSFYLDALTGTYYQKITAGTGSTIWIVAVNIPLLTTHAPLVATSDSENMYEVALLTGMSVQTSDIDTIQDAFVRCPLMDEIMAVLGFRLSTIAFACTEIPVVTGNSLLTNTLSVNNGFWNLNPLEYQYQWNRNGVAIAGATRVTYTLTGADVAHRISCTVGAATASEISSSTSVETSSVVGLEATIAPAVFGDYTITHTLSVGTGVWNIMPTGYSYQWMKNGVAIAGATGSTYVLSVADANATIQCAVTASLQGSTSSVLDAGRGGTGSASSYSASVGGSGSYSTPSGGAGGGSGGSGGGGGYGGAGSFSGGWGSGSGGTMVWSNSWGSTGNWTGGSWSYGSWSWGSGASVSNPTVVGLQCTTGPSIKGATFVGGTIYTTNGTWNVAPTTYTYQWYRDGVAIAGATSYTYTLTSADMGHSVTCSVGGYLGVGGVGVTVPTGTPASRPIASSFLNLTAPAITGTLIAGNVLSIDTGTWNADVDYFEYEWVWYSNQWFDFLGSSPTAIPLVSSLMRCCVTAHVGSAIRGIWSAYVTIDPITCTGAPVVSGNPAVRSTMSVSNGSWNTTPDSYTYTWHTVRGNFAGGSTYVITGLDSKHPWGPSYDYLCNVYCTVRAWKNGAWKDYDSAKVSIQPLQITGSAPAISGTLVAGSTLATTNGVWNVEPDYFEYQWYVDLFIYAGHPVMCPITGGYGDGAGTTYITKYPSHNVQCRVTAVIDGVRFYATSSPVWVDSIHPIADPYVTGAYISGMPLTMHNGTWNIVPDYFTYAWRQTSVFGSNIFDRSTDQLYTPLSDTNGALNVNIGWVTGTPYAPASTIYCTITAHYNGLAKSFITTPVPMSPISAYATPSITGVVGYYGPEARIVTGTSMTVTAGPWNVVPDYVTYQIWDRTYGSVTADTGTNNVIAVPAGGFTGSPLMLRVVAHLGSSVGYSTYPLPLHFEKLASTTAPSITVSGTAAGSIASVSHTGDWNAPPDSYSYVWRRSGVIVSYDATYSIPASATAATVYCAVVAYNNGGGVSTGKLSNYITLPRNI